MKKIFVIILVLFMMIFPTFVFASEGAVPDVNIRPPEMYCYASSSSGHSCINVIISTDKDILWTSSLSEEELTEKFSANSRSLQVQFDYSVGDDSSWNYQPCWEPDRAGFFKSPVYLRCDDTDKIIEKKIFDLGYDEYLDILSEKAYVGNNGGWKNVNLYDFSKNPVYIKARYVYTVENSENNIYHTFISDWSESVRVSERIVIDEEIAAPEITVLSTVDEILQNKEITLRIESNDEIQKAMMQLSHYDGVFEIFAAYRSDDGEYVSAGISDVIFNGTTEVTFPVNIDENTSVIDIMCCLEYDGSEKYDLDAISTLYAEETIIFNTIPEIEPETPPEVIKPQPPADDDDSTPIMLYIFPAILAPIIGGAVMMMKKKR